MDATLRRIFISLLLTITIGIVHAQMVTPAAPVIISPVNNTVLTQDNLIFAGTAVPNLFITIYVDNIIIARDTADASGNWVVTGQTLTNGKHIITATATDSSHLGTATSAMSNAVVITVNLIAPVLPIVSIHSDNPNSGSFAKLGDVVTLYFTINDAVFLPQVILAGHPVQLNVLSSRDFTATWTMNETDAEGRVPFSITFTDYNGNKAAPVTGTTDNSEVIYDITQPMDTLTTDAISPVTRAFQATISFNEAISDFNMDLLQVTNGVVSNVSRRSNNIISMLVTPVYDGDVTLQVQPGATTDAAGNPCKSSNLLKIYAAFNGLLLRVYPNPTTDILHVEFTGTVNSKALITIVNYVGITVYRQEIALDGKALTVHLDSVPPGAYMLFIRSTNYSFYTNVMVVH